MTTYVSAPEFTPESARQILSLAVERVRALPGVKNAAITHLLPLMPIGTGCAAEPGGEAFPATSSIVGQGYLATMRIPLVAGRDFSAADLPNGPPVAIVNETLARRLARAGTAIGKRVLLGCRNPVAVEVIGVARDSKFLSLGDTPRPHVYRPFSQAYGGIQNIIVETGPDPGVMMETVRQTIAASHPGVRIYGVKRLSQWVDDSYWHVRWVAVILGAFAGLALVLAGVGLYGVAAYHVTLRTRELGIRMSVGARPGDVFRLVLQQGLTLTLLGVGIGLALAVALAPVIARLLYGVSATDAPTYVMASLLWLAVAAVACYLPARRAARVEPLEALRYE